MPIESLKYTALEFAVDMYRGDALSPDDVVRAARKFETYLEEKPAFRQTSEAVELEQLIGLEVTHEIQGPEQDSTATED